MRLKVSLCLSVVFFSSLIWFFTCGKGPTNPWDVENTSVSLLLMSSNYQVSDTAITDTVGKTIQVKVCLKLTEHIDSTQIVIRPDQASLDTSITCFLKEQSIDTAKYDIVFSKPGDRTVTATAYIGREYRKVTAVIHILPNPGKNSKPVIVIGGNLNVVTGQTCLLSVAVKDPDVDQTHTVEMTDHPAGATFVDNTFSWTTALADTGSHIVTFIARENETSPALADTHSVTIKVVETLSPPSRPENLTILENKDGFLTLGWKQSARADAYKLYQGAARRGMYVLIDSTTDTLYKDSVGATSWYYYVQAKNTKGVSPASDTVYFNGEIVNRAPVINIKGRRNVISGETCTLSVSATDPDLGQNHTFEAVSSPSGATFAINTFIWATTSSDAGSHEIIFKVHDDGTPQLGDSETVVITVSETLLPPEKPLNFAIAGQINRAISLSWDAALRADQYHIFRGSSKSGDYHALDTVTGRSIHDTVPSAGKFYYFLIAANRQGVSPSSDTLMVDVAEIIANHAPVFGANTPATSYPINEAEALTIPVKVTDADNDPFSWSMVNTTLPRSSTIRIEKDTITWQSQTGDSGSFTITLRATDGMDSTDARIVVLVGDVNAPPVWKKKNMTVTIKEAEAYSLSLPDTIINTDNDPLTFTLLSGAPANDSITTQNHRYVFAAGYGDSGSYDVQIVVSDGTLSDTLFMQLNVLNVNRLPVISGAKDTTVKIGSSIEFTVSATDPDADAVTLKATGVPTGATFTATSGVFSWTPGAAQSGQFPVTFIAKDGTDSTSRKITITISNNEKPVITLDPVDRTVLAGQPDSFSVAATGAGTLTYQWQKNGTDLSGKTGTVLKITTVSIADTGLYACVVSNDGGKTTSKTARLTVQFSVTYDGNQKTGGTAPAGANYNFGAKFAIAGNTGTLVRTGYTFAGWNTKADGSGTSYAPADSFTMGASHVTLYAKWSQKTTFTLTVNATNGSVTKSPNATAYDSGTVVKLTPVPANGYHFTVWSGGLTGTGNPDSIIMNSSKTVTAEFAVNAANSFSLTVLATNGTVKKTPDSPQYDSGTSVGLKATAAAGYHFVNWTGDATGTTDSTTVLMNAAKSVTANFAIKTYALTINATNGTVAKSPNATEYDSGTVVSLTATPVPGYQFNGWAGGLTGTTNPASITMNAVKTVTANFVLKKFALTVNATNGTVAKSPNATEYDSGAVVSLTATPAPGYQFNGWAGDLTGTTNPASITMNAVKTVTANFVLKKFALTVNATNGTVAKSPNATEYDSGAVVSLTATPAPGYQFNGWAGDLTGTTNPASITMNAVKTVTANFVLKKFALTVNATNGTVARSPNATEYDSGAVVSLTATPAPGYQFNGWAGDLTGTTNPASITMNAVKTVTANFVLKKFALTVNATNGTVARSPNATEYDSGAVVTLTPTPAAGYTFSSWSGSLTGTANPGSITMNSAKTVTANFALKKFALTVNATNGTVARSPNATEYDSGAVVSLTATPAPGYQFAGWSGALTGTANPTSILMNGAKSVTASFTLKRYTLTVNATNGTVARSPNATEYDSGTVVTLTATPTPGYLFTGWSGSLSGTTNPTSILMNGAKSVTANFTANNPTASVTPTSRSVCEGTVGVFDATPSGGGGQYSYAWFHSDGTATGLTGARLNCPTAGAPAGNYYFYCRVTDQYGMSNNSNTVTLTVNKTVITTEPTDVTVCLGTGNTFTCAATGQGTLTYQWYQDVNGTIYTLGGGPSLTISGAVGPGTPPAPFSLYYYCVVTSSTGCQAQTRTASLNVLALPATLPVPWNSSWYNNQGPDVNSGNLWIQLNYPDPDDGSDVYYSITNSEDPAYNVNSVLLPWPYDWPAVGYGYASYSAGAITVRYWHVDGNGCSSYTTTWTNPAWTAWAP